MRFLGIDYGKKRIGIAISDAAGEMAFPKTIVLNDKNTIKKIKEIILKDRIEEIVIGDTLNLKGLDNSISSNLSFFIKDLKKEFNLPIHKQKEFFTSIEARGRSGKEINNARKVKKQEIGKIDDSAAALILQRYLDEINKK